MTTRRRQEDDDELTALGRSLVSTVGALGDRARANRARGEEAHRRFDGFETGEPRR